MYRISVPINSTNVNPKTRAEYLSLFKSADVRRVFLTHTHFFASREEEAETVASLRENLRYFEENGIEAAIWIGNSIGHGGELLGCPSQKTEYTPLMNLSGQVLQNTRCPLDRSFQQMLGNYLAALARTGTKTILIDDDFRLNQHKPEYCCVCDLHMERIRELCGEEIQREQIRELVFGGKTNKYRRAWLQAQGDSLRELAHSIRRAVDAVDPTVRLALCSAHSPWDIDGCSSVELTKILAGNNPPLLRLHGAPYWVAVTNKPFAQVMEIARLFGSLAKSEGMELMAEGDVYPRPRSVVPSSYLELFDAVIRADGSHDGILKYMADYIATPEYDTGYFHRHIRNLPRMEKLTEYFRGGTPLGVRILAHSNLMEQADFTLGTPTDHSPLPVAGWMMQACSIPTVYGEHEGLCNAIFGEEGRHCTEKDLAQGAVLDAVSAMILAERGIDVGLRGGEFFRDPISSLDTDSIEIPSEHLSIWDGSGRFLRPELCKEASPVLFATAGDRKEIFAYRYENQTGQRFLVYLFEGLSLPKTTGLLNSFLVQKGLIEHLEWIARTRIPVLCPKNPDLYVLCSQKEDAVTVGLFNASVDSVLDPTIRLDADYHSVEFLDCEGDLNGNILTLNRPIPAFDFVAFRVKKQ